MSSTASKIAPRERGWRGRIRRFDPHVTRLTGILLLLIVFFFAMRPESMMRPATWQAMGVQFPEFGLMALGVMLTMITGGIDLSSVGIANMTSISAAMIMLAMTPEGATGSEVTVAIVVAMLAAILIGTLAGVFNGFLVAVVKIPPILATLGTLELFTGIAIILTAGRPLSGLPLTYSQTFGGRVMGIPVPLLVFIAVALVVGFILKKMAFGAKLYMLGTNATAAKFSGLNATSLLIRTYALSGMCAAVAGLVMLANYNSAKADYGVAYTLLTVLIVVLGGVNPYGGSGKLAGVLLAIVILQILSSGLNMFPQISNFYRPLIWGAVLLFVISTSDFGKGFLSRFRRRKGETHEDVS